MFYFGANINLVPLSVVKRLSLGELTPTTVTLQMAERTLAQLKGILEDVLIKVGKLIFFQWTLLLFILKKTNKSRCC